MEQANNKENNQDGLKKADNIDAFVDNIQAAIPDYTINAATKAKVKFAKITEEVNKASKLNPESTNT